MPDAPRVLVVSAGADASAHLRLRWPGAALAEKGYPVAIAPPNWQTTYAFDRDSREVLSVEMPDCDVVVFQRLQSRAMVDCLPFLQAKGIAVVVDVDDDFAAIDPANAAWRSTHPLHSPDSNFHHLQRACRLADLVTCSTPALARRYGRDHSIVLPNRIPEALLSLERKHRDVPVLGWAGTTATHPHDLQVTGGAVARAVAETGAKFLTIGDGVGVAKALGFAHEVEATGLVDLHHWYQSLLRLDVGIAPLRPGRFAEAKSALKVLEGAATGVAMVASPTEDNRRLAAEGMCLLADKPKAWGRALRAFLTDHAYRTDFAAKAREQAKAHTIQANAESWWSAWTLAAESRARGLAHGASVDGVLVAVMATQLDELEQKAWHPTEPHLGLATTGQLLEELRVRMEVTQNSLKGRDLGRLCREALDNLAASVLAYTTVGPWIPQTDITDPVEDFVAEPTP